MHVFIVKRSLSWFHLLPNAVDVFMLISSELILLNVAICFCIFLCNPDIVKDSKVLQKVFFVAILSEDFKDADHLIVSVLNQWVEERDGRVLDHSKHCILPKNLVLILHYTFDIFGILVSGVSRLSQFIHWLLTRRWLWRVVVDVDIGSTLLNLLVLLSISHLVLITEVYKVLVAIWIWLSFKRIILLIVDRWSIAYHLICLPGWLEVEETTLTCL